MSLKGKLLLLVFLGMIQNDLLLGSPWGKDSDLAIPCHPVKPMIESSPSSKKVLTRLGETIISFHQNVISHADGPRSNFIPSSSQYTLEAINKYGFFQGSLHGFDRLMRENDDEWVYGKILGPLGVSKYDPLK